MEVLYVSRQVALDMIEDATHEKLMTEDTMDEKIMVFILDVEIKTTKGMEKDWETIALALGNHHRVMEQITKQQEGEPGYEVMLILK